MCVCDLVSVYRHPFIVHGIIWENNRNWWPTMRFPGNYQVGNKPKFEAWNGWLRSQLAGVSRQSKARQVWNYRACLLQHFWRICFAHWTFMLKFIEVSANRRSLDASHFAVQTRLTHLVWNWQPRYSQHGSQASAGWALPMALPIATKGQVHIDNLLQEGVATSVHLDQGLHTKWSEKPGHNVKHHLEIPWNHMSHTHTYICICTYIYIYIYYTYAYICYHVSSRYPPLMIRHDMTPWNIVTIHNAGYRCVLEGTWRQRISWPSGAWNRYSKSFSVTLPSPTSSFTWQRGMHQLIMFELVLLSMGKTKSLIKLAHWELYIQN